MTKITVIYRCCEGDTKGAFRPPHFSKVSCLNNFLDVFKFNDKPKDVAVDIIAVHDGPAGTLYNMLEELDVSIYKIDVRSNENSLLHCLDLGAKLTDTDIIYFLEDDYLHIDGALEVLIDGFETAEQFNKSNIISTYLHPDRFTRQDDIDRGKTHLLLGKTRYWRTAESTTCTWAIRHSTYIKDGVYEKAKQFKLNDRELFRSLHTQGTILFNPLNGASTHCHLPFMSPFIDWSSV